jgi:hypothetical protein
MKVGVQLRQTIISTGAVGACLGAVVVLGLLVVGPGSDARLVAQGIAPPNWGAVATGYLIAFVTITAGSVVLFGLLPAAIGYLLGRVANRWRKNV